MDPSWVRCCGLVSGVNGISQWFFSQLFFTSYSPALGDDPHLFSQFWKLMEIAYLCFPTRFCLYNSTTPGLLVQSLTNKKRLPSGKRLHSYGKSPFLMGKSTIDGHFPKLFWHNQRVSHILWQSLGILNTSRLGISQGHSKPWMFQHHRQISSRLRPCRIGTI